MRVPGARETWACGPVGQARDPRLRRVEALSWFLDNAIRIPGLGYRIGYEALIGLVPVIGDFAGMALSAFIVVEAARLHVRRATLARMVLNVGLETLIGAIPALGDLFDVVWKANARNVALIHRDLGVSGGRQEISNRRFFLLLGVVLVLVVGAAVGLIVLLAGAVARLLGL